jgi:uncharacterized protein (UPF0297 family)
MNRWEAVDRVQVALRRESYKPSPGQMMDHVNHRIAEAAINEIWVDLEEVQFKVDHLRTSRVSDTLRDIARNLDEKDRRKAAQDLHVSAEDVPMSFITEHGDHQRELRRLADIIDEVVKGEA